MSILLPVAALFTLVMSAASAAEPARVEVDLSSDILVHPGGKLAHFPRRPQYILFKDKEKGDRLIPTGCNQRDTETLLSREKLPEIAQLAKRLIGESEGYLENNVILCFNHSAHYSQKNPKFVPFPPFAGTSSATLTPKTPIVSMGWREGQWFSFQTQNPLDIAIPQYFATINDGFYFAVIVGRTIVEKRLLKN